MYFNLTPKDYFCDYYNAGLINYILLICIEYIPNTI